MPNYQTKKGKISSKKPIPKISQKLLGMKNIKTKPVKKIKGGGIGKLASILSPAYGIMKGQGPFSKIASMGPSTNALSVFAKSQAEDAKRRRAEMSGAGKAGSNRMTPMTGMMAGGPLKRKKSIDGCAMKGKTRAV